MRLNHKRGIGTVGIIAVIAVVVIIIGGGVYMTSDVWRTRMNVAYDGFAHWTPENIAKDPVNYLNFCEEQAKAAMLKLEAAGITINQQSGRMSALKDETDNHIRVGVQTLGELKDKYKAAATSNGWPIQFAGVNRDEDWCKRQIMSLDHEVTGKQALLQRLDTGLKQLEVQKTKVRDQKAQCQQQISQIQTNREMLKVQQITDDLKKQLIDMKAMIASSVDAADDAGSVLSLEQITASKETTVDEAKFQDILNK